MPTSAATTRDATRVLFTPFDLAGLRLKNRLIMAPMGTCLDEDGHITDATIAYYRRRAEGGVGTITVEGVLVSADTEGPEPKISGPEYLPGLKRLVEALRPYDDHDRRAAHAPGPPGRARPDRRAVAGAAELARADPARADRARDRRHRRGLREGRRPGARGRVRLRRGPRRARLPAVELPFPARQPPLGFVRRLAREPRAVQPRGGARDHRDRRPGDAAGLAHQRRRRDARRADDRRGRRGLAVAGRDRRRGDQRLRRHLAHAARDARADVRPARAHGRVRGRRQARRERAGDRGRPARRSRARGEGRRRRRRRPGAARPRADRRARLAGEGRGGPLQRAAAVHRLQRLRRPGRPRRARPLLREPGGRARARVGGRADRPPRAA